MCVRERESERERERERTQGKRNGIKCSGKGVQSLNGVRTWSDN